MTRSIFILWLYLTSLDEAVDVPDTFLIPFIHTPEVFVHYSLTQIEMHCNALNYVLIWHLASALLKHVLKHKMLRICLLLRTSCIIKLIWDLNFSVSAFLLYFDLSFPLNEFVALLRNHLWIRCRSPVKIKITFGSLIISIRFYFDQLFMLKWISCSLGRFVVNRIFFCFEAWT